MCKFSKERSLIFFHVPKCGGISYAAGKDWDKGPDHEHYNYCQARNWFSSHGLIEFFDKADMEARVREPIPRVVSFYSYYRWSRNRGAIHSMFKEMDFDTFVKEILGEGSRIIIPAFDFLADEYGKINKRMKVHRLEDVKGEEIRNASPSERVTPSEESKQIIREIFKKDYKTWYK